MMKHERRRRKKKGESSARRAVRVPVLLFPFFPPRKSQLRAREAVQAQGGSEESIVTKMVMMKSFLSSLTKEREQVA